MDFDLNQRFQCSRCGYEMSSSFHHSCPKCGVYLSGKVEKAPDRSKTGVLEESWDPQVGKVYICRNCNTRSKTANRKCEKCGTWFTNTTQSNYCDIPLGVKVNPTGIDTFHKSPSISEPASKSDSSEVPEQALSNLEAIGNVILGTVISSFCAYGFFHPMRGPNGEYTSLANDLFRKSPQTGAVIMGTGILVIGLLGGALATGCLYQIIKNIKASKKINLR